MVIAIDGPAASGKSTIAKRVATALDFAFLNSGQMYRSVTWKALQAGVTNDQPAILRQAAQTVWQLVDKELHIDGQPPSADLHSDAVDQLVSPISAITTLRQIINTAIRAIAIDHDIVVEGRDMCSVVFPDTKFKFYVDASIEARVKRRLLQGTTTLAYNELFQAIQTRDHSDQTKAVGSLLIAPDADYIDSSVLTIDEVCDKVLESIQGKFATISGAPDRNEH